MNLKELSSFLVKNGFSVEEILDFIHATYTSMVNKVLDGDLDVVYPETIGKPLEDLSFLETLIQYKLGECQRCGRCKERNTVVIPEGKLNSKIFIVNYEPSSLDDRTGIPLSSSFEVKGGKCGICSNFPTCYSGPIDNDYKASIPCSLQLPKNKEDAGKLTQVVLGKSNKEFTNLAKNLSDAITFKSSPDPVNYKFVRESWNQFFSLVDDSKANTIWKKPTPFYITNLLKCYGNLEDLTCLDWLVMERTLCSANHTIILEEKAYTTMSSKLGLHLPKYEDNLYKEVETKSVWGTIIPMNISDTETFKSKFHQICVSILEEKSTNANLTELEILEI